MTEHPTQGAAHRLVGGAPPRSEERAVRWNVYLEAAPGFGPVAESGCRAVKELLPAALRARVTGRPVFTVALQCEGASPAEAVEHAASAVRMAVADGIDGVLDIAHAQATRPEARIGVPSGGLISHRGLAQRFNLTEAWVRELMTRPEAPAPVPVEGASRGAIYPTLTAVAWVASETGNWAPSTHL